MKGYFSQLARHTGLQFTNAQAKPQTVRHTRPLHVEEVTLVQAMESVTSASTDDGPVTPQKTYVAPPQITQPSASVSETVPAETRVRIGDEQSTQIERESFAIAPQSIAAEQNVAGDQTGSPAVEKVDQLERVEVQVVPPVPPTPAETSDQETKVDTASLDLSDFDLSEPVERERMVRQYLREVQAWVAAGPIAEDDAAESESGNTAAPESVAIAVERSPLPPPEPSASRDAIDVHDMNLSIGAISVVIEEPKSAAATVIAPTPAAPAPQLQTQHEPISLSRYYLRSW